MKHFKTLALTTAAAIGFMMAPAHAADTTGFTAHHLVPKTDYANYAANLPANDKLELREYIDYELREPCQNYQPAPDGFYQKDCDLGYNERKQMEKVAVTKKMELRPVISDYTVYFDFDKSNIRTSEVPTLEKVAQEIKKYDPFEVTIEGHADRSGPSDYNVGLSKERAMSVSQALSERGIPNRVIDQQAEGETEPAVPTRDGVRLQENRRVEIQFRK